MTALAEVLALRRRDPLYRLLARRWAACVAVFLGAGVASGTIVAVQLQLLWPAFMRLAGQIIALPLAIEVFAGRVHRRLPVRRRPHPPRSAHPQRPAGRRRGEGVGAADHRRQHLHEHAHRSNCRASSW